MASSKRLSKSRKISPEVNGSLFPESEKDGQGADVRLSSSDYFEEFYRLRTWTPFDFQREMLAAMESGYHGLLNAPTGSGKTYAAWIPFISCWMARHPDYAENPGKGLKLIWITPLRALARDISEALQVACDAFDLPWRVETRTGDTSPQVKKEQIKRMPEALITTPESLHVLLARKGNPKLFKDLEAIVVDEWHELIGSKRGVQVELGLSRLRAMRPELMTWGISATIGNLVQSMEVLVGPAMDQDRCTVVKADFEKKLEMITLMPTDPELIENMPWGGHLGIQLLDQALPVIRKHNTTLVFTNTRSQAEIWYQKILDAHPSMAGAIAMHHGSLDRDLRDWVEDGLHSGDLDAVVCTSSLDLGVDFRPVDTVIQVGGPKGVARFKQRAGRSGHAPGETSLIHFLPTYALELVEAHALQEALKEGYVEKREPIIMAYDVLVQYLVTLAVGEGFRASELLEEIRQTNAFAGISEEAWSWCLNFITVGGKSLRAYDEYRRVEWEDGKFKVTDKRGALRHRLQIGTIVGDSLLHVRYVGGGRLGTIEERFIAGLNEGDTFWFAGKVLEFIMIKDMTALVRKSKRKTGRVPAWAGGRMAFTSYLSKLFRKALDDVSRGKAQSPELKTLDHLFSIQRERSMIPKEDTLLIEQFETREGWHTCVFPMEGRLVHEAMAGLMAWRIARFHRASYSIAMNDYGFELLSDEPLPIERAIGEGVFSAANLIEDVMSSINSAEMARRRFRDIAAIAGLTFKGYPGRIKRSKHLQASSGLVFDVFAEYEPDNLLLRQAYHEVMEYQFEEARMRSALKRIAGQKIEIVRPELPTPFAFPIMLERIREKMTTESLEERIRKMKLS